MNWKQLTSKQFLTIFSGLFLSFCLYVYQAYEIPTGISDSGHQLWLRVLLFGLLTSLNFGLWELINVKVFKSKISLIALRSVQVFVGATLTFFLFNVFWHWTNMTWSGYIKMLFEYFGILIVPISLTFFYEKYLLKTVEKRIEKNVDTISSLLSLSSSNGKHLIKIKAQDFLYAKAEDNYVQCFYLLNSEVKSKLLRNTLTKVAQSISNAKIKRCHRSYLVNTENVQQILQKNKKTFLQLKNIEQPIPVSANYIEDL